MSDMFYIGKKKKAQIHFCIMHLKDNLVYFSVPHHQFQLAPSS